MILQILLILQVNYFVFSQDIRKISFGETIQNHYSKLLNLNGSLFSLSLEEKVENQNLIITALADQERPEILVFKINTIHPEIQNEILNCAQSGNNFCIIDQSQLEAGQPLYILLICKNDCNYNLRVDYKEEFILGKNGIVEFEMKGPQSSKIVKIDLEVYSKSDVELEVEARILNQHESENQLNIYLNQGNQVPTTTNYDFIGLDTGRDSKLINLSIQYYPYYEMFTLLVVAESGSKVQVQTKTFGIRRDLNI